MEEGGPVALVAQPDQLRVDSVRLALAGHGRLVEQAAGITKGIQIYDFIMVGNDGAGSASGILKSPDPLALLDEMVSYVRKAKDDLARQKKLK